MRIFVELLALFTGLFAQHLVMFTFFFIHATVLIDHAVFIYLVLVYGGMNTDVVATAKVVVVMHMVSATFMIDPATAAASGGVSGDANVRVTVTLSSILSAVRKPLGTTNV